ncbi:MAG: hypothetical protein PHQ25_00110 [Acidobacteriota bacterium]|nr:hypothetical protein [Acidobacteriota bacterium]MDW3228453.1 hypothetical protein [Acidobacteriota bacterium]MDY0231435.1 hypothetical protein [Candidatus Saccharicenans sp.]
MKKKEVSEKRITTSIRIDPDLWFKAKLSALQRGMKISEYIEYLIEKEINRINVKKD